MWSDFTKHPSIKAGEDLEDDTADVFFPDNIYEMLHRTHDVNTNRKRFIRSSLNPDFQFEIRNTNIQFWVECKHRENNSDSSVINVFKGDQLRRYKSYSNCFLFLCTHRYDEQFFFLVPMKVIQWDNLFLSFLWTYEVTMEPPIMPGLLKKYLR